MSHQIVKTADGSDTIYISELDETYHSIFGAVQEANHIFIENGLVLVKKEIVSILEIGFGTGLNALLSAKYAIKNKQRINYITVEKFPLDINIINELNYSDHSNPDEILFKKIHEVEWEKLTEIDELFSIQKLNVDLLQYELKISTLVDIIFFDAFSPSKQSEMWDEKIFKILYQLLNPSGILVTYSSAGIVKKALRASGFNVKRLQGPPGKHHIIIAFKANLDK